MSTAQDWTGLDFTMGDRLAKALDRAGFSVNEAAMRFGKARQTIGAWLAGRNEPSRVELETWAEWTNAPLEYLLYGVLPDGEPVAQRPGGRVRRQGLEPRTRWLEVVAA